MGGKIHYPENSEDILTVRNLLRVVNGGLTIVPNRAIRAVENRPGRFKAYGALFGSPDAVDLYGTFFTPDTNFYLNWFNRRPWIYDHGMNDMLGGESNRIGEWVDVDIDEEGVFFVGELMERHKYVNAIEQLLDEQVLYPSSGTLDYMAKFDWETGEIKDWPIVEVSSTVAPAEWRMNPIGQSARNALQVLGGETMKLNLKEAWERLQSRLNAPDMDEEDSEEEESSEGEEGEEKEREEPSNDSAMDVVDAALTADEVARGVVLIDAALEDLNEEVQELRSMVEEMREDDTRRLRNVAREGRFYKDLFVARHAGEEAEDEDVEEAQNASRGPADGGGVFSRIQGA